MKISALRRSLCIFIFLAVTLASFLAVRPLLIRLSETVTGCARRLCLSFEETTGLSVGYESLSPSILTGLRIKGIVLRDVSDGKTVVEIRRATLRYRLSGLLSRDFSRACRDLTVDGFTLDFDREGDGAVLEKLSGIARALSRREDGGAGNAAADARAAAPEGAGGESAAASAQTAPRPGSAGARVRLPFDVFLRNVSVVYRDGGASASVLLKKASLRSLPDGDALSVQARGAADFSGREKAFSCGFSADGAVRGDLDGSAVTLRISDASAGRYAFGRLNLLLTYSGRTLEFRTVQNAFPFYVRGSYGFDTRDAELSAGAEDLTLGSLFTAGGRPDRRLSGISAEMTARVRYNTASGKLGYDSSGKIRVPGQTVSGGLDAAYAVRGDRERLFVDSLTVTGKNCDADFSGVYRFRGMRLSGTANLNGVTLRNGGVLATELYFDPLDSGFMCFAPQLMLDGKALTALQLTVIPGGDSVNFGFELLDYAHEDAEEPGQIRIDGSFLSGRKFVQAGVSASGMYLDSIAETVSFFARREGAARRGFGALSPYMLSGEVFISSDFSTVSYNVPYTIVADTRKDGRFVYLSLDGNDSSVQLSRCALFADGRRAELSAQFERSPDSADAFFTADMSVGFVPYHFTGSVLPGALSVSGDYGFMLDARSLGGGRYSGSFFTEAMPFSAGRALLTVSADTGFSYSPEDGVSVQIARLEAAAAGGSASFEPKLVLTGSVSKYGALFDSISYSDMFSSLDGGAECLWNVNGGVFDSASLQFRMKNPVSQESAELTAQVLNPDRAPVTAEDIRKSFYLNSQLVLRDFGLNRFTAEHSRNNSVSATVIVTGTPENPYVGLSVDSFGIMAAGNVLTAGLSAYLEEKVLTVDDFHAGYGRMTLDGGRAVFYLNTFSGTASAELNAAVLKRTVRLPLSVSVTDTAVRPGSVLPYEFAVSVVSDSVSGTLFTEPFPLSLTVVHTEGDTAVFTSESIGLSGHISDGGLLDFSMAEGKPVRFQARGDVSGSTVDVAVTGLSADLGTLFQRVDLEALRLYSGKMDGSVRISGMKSDPDFMGAVSVRNADFSLPKVVPYHITVPDLLAVVSHSEIDVPEVAARIRGKYPAFASAKIFLDRWTPDRLEASVRTADGVFVPANLNVRVAEFKGEAAARLDLAFDDGYLDITGGISVRNTAARAKISEIVSPSASPARPYYIRADLAVTLGSHVSFSFDPVLRCVFVPDSRLSLKYDQEAAAFAIDGDVALRSGDVAYLSRSFYLKEGAVKFHPNETSFNPFITVRAETRERDEKGNDVRLILSADNQPLLDFHPRFSSIPAKSEAELNAMLGQVAAGDSENAGELLLAAGDYAVQSVIGRSIENKLRDLFNFDIFSVRTMILQNTLKQGLSRSSGYSDMTVGNLLDNSTVYIGKYFGSVLYADALMHWSYDETRSAAGTAGSGLVFRPEFGLELEAPFANIRWNMAPDISAMMNDSFVFPTSVTLSWKISF